MRQHIDDVAGKSVKSVRHKGDTDAAVDFRFRPLNPHYRQSWSAEDAVCVFRKLSGLKRCHEITRGNVNILRVENR